MIRAGLLEKLPGMRHGFGTRVEEYPGAPVTARQVHGAEIYEVREASTEDLNGFDVLMTERPGIAIAVKTADCLPILLADPERRLVAAVHAGWRGTVQRVVQKAVRRMMEKGASLQNLHVALGPNMGGRCYEVGSDVQSAVEREFPGAPVLVPKSEKWLLDVGALNRWQLLEMGLPAERIERIDLCTHCRPDLFHSYRRDGEKAGRMLNLIELL